MARAWLSVSVLVLAVSLCWAGAGDEQAKAERPPVVTLRTVITGTCQELQRYAESLVGAGVIRSAAEFLQTAIQFLAEGAASGLNVIAVYVTEILRVTGFDVALTLPRFTPEGVTSVAQWGLVGLIAYWILTILLRLLIAVFKQLFWVVKTVLALWLFGLIVTDKHSSAETTAIRVGILVLVVVLLTLFTSASEKSSNLEGRLNKLEGRLRAVERRKEE
ncbi:uncharacterized protein LOC124860472 isoform X2 [Girardinichthys multiradiatus]|uniref:uncharacterized protein LOC124860472 isoform X2 n=1 Tax=Girardinichthys multiradiatus TaxID=208333 RepID=UPI001FAE103C|nr:uncharacterized protein LOC124860472 isoform X2 [Girardinichthys multiradiatus]